MAMEAISNLGVYQAVQPVVQPIATKPQTERQEAQLSQEASQQAQAPAGDLTITPVQDTGKQDGQGELNEQQQEAQRVDVQTYLNGRLVKDGDLGRAVKDYILDGLKKTFGKRR